MATMPTVLVVGGDKVTRLMLRFLVQDMGCRMIETLPANVLSIVSPAAQIDLTVGILQGASEGGLDSLVALQRAGYRGPICLLVRESSLALRKQAMALGIREIVSLPVSPRDLQQHLQSLLATNPDHAHWPASEIEEIWAGGLHLDPTACQVSNGKGWSVRLTRREAALLHALMVTPGRPILRQELLEHGWGNNYSASDNALSIHMRRIREKLQGAPRQHNYIRAMRNQGYTFEARRSPRTSLQRQEEAPSRVLVVDEPPSTLRTMAVTLQAAGYAVNCGPGNEALVLAQCTQPAVIVLHHAPIHPERQILDRQLGAELRTLGIPVIVVVNGKDARQAAKELSADDYLVQPFDQEELLLRVERCARPERLGA